MTKTTWLISATLLSSAFFFQSAAKAQGFEFRASGGGTVVGGGPQAFDAIPPVGLSFEIGVTAGQSSVGLSVGMAESVVDGAVSTIRGSLYYSRSFRPHGLIVPRMTLDLGGASLDDILSIFGGPETRGSLVGSALFGFDLGRGTSRGFLEAGPRVYVPFDESEHFPPVWVGLHIRAGYRFASS